jgi:hypothetical protein
MTSLNRPVYDIEYRFARSRQQTYIFLTGEEDWPEPINTCLFGLQCINRVWPIVHYEFNNRSCTLHDTTVRTVVRNELKGSWLDRGEI